MNVSVTQMKTSSASRCGVLPCLVLIHREYTHRFWNEHWLEFGGGFALRLFFRDLKNRHLKSELVFFVIATNGRLLFTDPLLKKLIHN